MDEEDEDDVLIPATQFTSAIPASTFYQRQTPQFKSLSRLSDSIRASTSTSAGASSQVKAVTPLHSMRVLPLPTQSPPVPTQGVTLNALQYTLPEPARVDEQERTGTASLEPTQTSTQQNDALALDPPPLIQCKVVTSGGYADTGSTRLNGVYVGGKGIPPGGALELIGPSGSGKTQWALQVALRLRLDSLQGSGPSQQILIIDTEGSITPSLLHDIAHSLTEDDTASANAILAGTHLLHATTPADQIATLRILTSPYRTEAQAGIPHIHSLAAVVLDSTSYHVRGPVQDPSSRRYIYSLLHGLHGALTSLNTATVLIATTQMALKMFTAQGDLVNYRVPDSIAWLVPQVVGIEDVPAFGKTSGVLGSNAVRVVLYRAVNTEAFGHRFAHVIYDGVARTVDSTQTSSPASSDVIPRIPFTFSSRGLIQEKTPQSAPTG